MGDRPDPSRRPEPVLSTPARALILTLRKGRGPVSKTIDDIPTDPTRWRLILDGGEGLEVRVAEDAGAGPDPFEVALFMSAARASDLGEVYGAYSRVAEVVQRAAEVSGTETSLARALRDAAAAARGGSDSPVRPTRITDRGRLAAMELLQQVRPDLSHSAVVSIVDAAAWWLHGGQDYMAMDLLSAITDDHGVAAYFALLDRPMPTPPPGPADTGPIAGPITESRDTWTTNTGEGQ
jgi:hypothetical protein